MKRRTRKQWYQYHLAKSQAAARAPLEGRYSALIAETEERITAARMHLKLAQAREPLTSKIVSLLGFRTKFQSEILSPLIATLNEEECYLSEIHRYQQDEVVRAEEHGTEMYRAAYARRKEEAATRSEHAVKRKQERRIKYLERSPSIRSAARLLKQLLIREYVVDDEFVACYYCGVSILASESHLEHKLPISRGGDNRRSNLVIACPSCNLKKGRKTHEEFLRGRNDDF